jgi:hypothetical protein
MLAESNGFLTYFNYYKLIEPLMGKNLTVNIIFMKNLSNINYNKRYT